MAKLVDLTGERFGRLTVIGIAGRNKHGKTLWHCECDCGKYTDVMVSQLTGGRTKSCGCLHKDRFKNTTHGESRTRLYRIWHAMKERCEREKAVNYKWYGGKGIKVCGEWRFSYETFRDWAIANGYSDDLTIDRIDSSKDYSPENCRWITRQENISRSAIEMQKRRKECCYSDNKS